MVNESNKNYLLEEIIDQAPQSPLTLESAEVDGQKYHYLSGIFQRADAPNSNARVYPRTVLDENVRELQPDIKAESVVVELDHPKEGPSLWNTIGILTELHECDSQGYVRGKIRLSEGESNRGAAQLLSLMNIGFKPGISSRGHSRSRSAPCVERRTAEDGNTYDYINSQYKLVTFDVVANPSVTDARTVGCLENEDMKGVMAMTHEERIAALRKLFAESSFEDIWAIFKENGMSGVLAKLTEMVFQERKADIEKMVADRVATEMKAAEAGMEQKVKDEAEKMANAALESEGAVVLDLLSLLKANNLVDDSGQVPEEVWKEAVAQWGASIDNDLFAGKKKMGAEMRTKIPSAGSVHKESIQPDLQSVIDTMKELVASAVTDAVKSHPSLQESEKARTRKLLLEKVGQYAKPETREHIVTQVGTMFDAGVDIGESHIQAYVTAQEKLLEATKGLRAESGIKVVAGQKGVVDPQAAVTVTVPVNEEITKGMGQLFG
jgi:hypothetical protein